MRLTEVATSDGKKRYALLDADGNLVEPVVRYLKFLDQRNLSLNTIRSYAYGLKFWFEYLDSKKVEYRQVGIADLGDFVFWLKLPYSSPKIRPSKPVTQARSNSTINQILKAIVSFYDYLWRRDELETNLNEKLRTTLSGCSGPYKSFLHHLGQGKPIEKHLLRQPEPRKRAPDVLKKDQVELVLSACMNRRDRLLVALLYETGMRIGEALALWLEDVDIAGRRLRVKDRGELPNEAAIKTPNAERWINVSGELVNHILDYVAEAHTDRVTTNHVFIIQQTGRAGQPLRYANVASLFRRLREKTGIEVRPHGLRHTHFTMLARAGWRPELLQERAGHKSFSHTYQLYVHPSEEDLQQSWQETEEKLALKQEPAKGT